MALTSSRTMASKSVGMTKEQLQESFKPTTEIPISKGLKMGVAAVEDGGKTHFCITPEGEVYCIDIEGEYRGVCEKFPEEVKNRLHIADIPFMMKESGKEINNENTLKLIEDEIEKLMKFAVDNPDEKGTIVIDSDTNLKATLNDWLTEQTDLVRSKNTGKMLRTEYGRINSRHKKIRDNLKLTGWNVIFTGRSYPSYDNSGNVNNEILEPRWNDELRGWCDVWGELKTIKGKKSFIIRRCRYDNTLIGDVIVEPTHQKVMDYVSEKTGIKFS